MQGRVFGASCQSILGQGRCALDMSGEGLRYELEVLTIADGVRLTLDGATDRPARWFERGRIEVLDGDARGLVGIVKNDLGGSLGREIELWEGIRADIASGDTVRLDAGCDHSFKMCREKFNNAINFQGFPHVPGEDRLLSIPVEGTTTDETGGK